MTKGKKLTVYMIDGTEYGPRFSEIGNWVGKGYTVHEHQLIKYCQERSSIIQEYIA